MPLKALAQHSITIWWTTSERLRFSVGVSELLTHPQPQQDSKAKLCLSEFGRPQTNSLATHKYHVYYTMLGFGSDFKRVLARRGGTARCIFKRFLLISSPPSSGSARRLAVGGDQMAEEALEHMEEAAVEVGVCLHALIAFVCPNLTLACSTSPPAGTKVCTHPSSLQLGEASIILMASWRAVRIITRRGRSATGVSRMRSIFRRAHLWAGRRARLGSRCRT